MSIFLLFLGCFILYGRSRFFPENLTLIGNIIKTNKQIALVLGYLFLLFSYIVFSYQFGWATGFVIYLLALCLFYSFLVIVLPLNIKYVYIIAMFCILLMLFKNFLI